MNEPTVVSLCTGAGGLDLGLEIVGYRTVAQAEIDPDACRVLRERFPGVPNLGDLKSIRWDDVVKRFGRPTVVAAGFPCQPLSLAGRGLVEADPRWLWPEVARCLRVVRPELVLLENVPGIFRRPPSGGPRPIGVVLADLAALGYDAVWTGLRAADVGAPHGRDRWFCVALLTSESRLERVDADSGVRRGSEGTPRRPAQAALPAGPEVAHAADALEDRAGAPADAERVARPATRERDGGPREGEVARERGGTGEAERRATGRDSGGGASAADAGRLGLEGPHGRELEGGRPEPARDGETPAVAGGVASGRSERGVEGSGGRERAPGDTEAAADADVEGREGAEPERAPGGRGSADGGGQAAPDAAGRGRGGRQDVEGSEPAGRSGTRADGEATADAGRDGLLRVPTFDGEDGGVDVERGDDPYRRDLGDAGPRDGYEGEAPADADGERGEPGGGRRATSSDNPRPGAEEPDGDGLVGETEPGTVEWGAYGPAIRRWEYVVGRLAPRPTDDIGRLNPRFAEWMLGYPYGWVEAEGVSRTAQLRLIGNSVQVQCGAVIGLWLAEIAGVPLSVVESAA